MSTLHEMKIDELEQEIELRDAVIEEVRKLFPRGGYLPNDAFWAQHERVMKALESVSED